MKKEEQQQQQSPSVNEDTSSDKIGGLYGDLVNALSFTTCVPIFWLMLLQDDNNNENSYRKAPIVTCIVYTVTGILSWIAWFHSHRRASFYACLANVASMARTSLGDWPCPGERVVPPHVCWILLVIIANRLHSLTNRWYLGATVLVTGIWLEQPQSPSQQTVSSTRTTTTKTRDLILFYIAAGSVFCVLDVLVTYGTDRIRARTAAILLCIYFCCTTAYELTVILQTPDYYNEGSINMVRGAVMAVVAIVAAGAFRGQVNAKLLLESQVQQRTAEIRQQAETLRMVSCALEASETAICITNEKQEIEWWNPAFLQYLTSHDDSDGETKQPLLSNRLLSTVVDSSSEDQDKIRNCFQQKGTIGDCCKVRPMEIMVRQSRVYTVEISPAQEDRFMAVFKDVTDLRALQLSQEKTQQEKIRATAMNDSIEVVSHELRTPLQGIMGITSLLLDNYSGALPGDTEESLSLVMVSSRLLLTLINNILDVRKFDASMMDELELKPVCAKQVLEQAVAFCRPLGLLHNVTLELDTIHESTAVLSDELRLQQVLINILSNAVKHSPEQTMVHVSSRIVPLADAKRLARNAIASAHQQSSGEDSLSQHKDCGNAFVVSIEDQGTGIDEAQCHQLFEKFSQLKERTPTSPQKSYLVGQPSGTGIGLNLCVKLILHMNGNIWLNNSAAGGACFSFYIPVVELPRDGKNTHDPLEESSTELSMTDETHHSCQGLLSSIPELSKIRVLVVDDILINLKVLDKMLHRIGVELVKIVDSGAGALVLMEAEEFDLVITDIQMPNMSGTDLSAEIRRRCSHGRVPVVVGLTAENSLDLDQRCFESGMKKVLHKPITSQELKLFLECLLSKTSQYSPVEPTESTPLTNMGLLAANDCRIGDDI